MSARPGDSLEERATRLLDSLPPDRSDRRPFALFVPGRIEVLGKHTDYAGGLSLTCTTRWGLLVVARPRTDTTLRIVDTTRGAEARIDLGSPELSGPSWIRYPAALARRLGRNFGPSLRGADLAIESDLPRAAGMSSSSAFLISIYLALAEANRLPEHSAYRAEIDDTLDLAAYLATIENGSSFGSLAGETGVGTRGGSEDHTAILCSERGRLGLYRYLPTRSEGSVALPDGLLFAVGVSGVHASKASGEKRLYNSAASLAAEAAEVWRRAGCGNEAHLGEILERSDTEALRSTLRDSGPRAAPLLTRFDHFELESRHLVPAAFAALEKCDLQAFGRVVERSQRGAEELLGNQVPETRALARLARDHGAFAASAFGAGFGGSVWALIERSSAEDFLTDWRRAYAAAHPERTAGCRFIATGAADPARRVTFNE